MVQCTKSGEGKQLLKNFYFVYIANVASVIEEPLDDATLEQRRLTLTQNIESFLDEVNTVNGFFSSFPYF